MTSSDLSDPLALAAALPLLERRLAEKHGGGRPTVFIIYPPSMSERADAAAQAVAEERLAEERYDVGDKNVRFLHVTQDEALAWLAEHGEPPAVAAGSSD